MEQYKRRGRWIDLITTESGKIFVQIRREATCPVMGVSVLPIIREHDQLFFLCIANKRPPVNAWVLELPGGYVDPGETA